MLKRFLMKKMMAAQLKGVPAEQQDKILDMIEKNPELFEKIAKEVKVLVSQGRDQQAASMEVMRKHQGELQKLMQ